MKRKEMRAAGRPRSPGSVCFDIVSRNCLLLWGEVISIARQYARWAFTVVYNNDNYGPCAGMWYVWAVMHHVIIAEATREARWARWRKMLPANIVIMSCNLKKLSKAPNINANIIIVTHLLISLPIASIVCEMPKYSRGNFMVSSRKPSINLKTKESVRNHRIKRESEKSALSNASTRITSRMRYAVYLGGEKTPSMA